MSRLEIFKPSDFKWTAHGVAITETANRILNEYIEKNGRVVYAFEDYYGWSDDLNKSPKITNTAILICIEPIKKKCEMHEPDKTKFMDIDIFSSTCKHCGIKLEPSEWKEAE